MPKPGGELGAPIWNNILWYTINPEYMLTQDLSWAVGSLGMGRNRLALENGSTATKMTVLPRDGGRPLITSKDIWEQAHLGIADLEGAS